MLGTSGWSVPETRDQLSETLLFVEGTVRHFAASCGQQFLVAEVGAPTESIPLGISLWRRGANQMFQEAKVRATGVLPKTPGMPRGLPGQLALCVARKAAFLFTAPV